MFQVYIGATLLLSTSDAASAIRRAYECAATFPASPVTIDRDGEEMTRAEIEDMAAELSL